MKKNLIDAAKRSSGKAYAPYSKFKVGAAIMTDSGKIFSGCNVENSSYSLTICAERNALFNAVNSGERNFKELVIYTETEKIFSPCGACRQVLSEFCDDLKITIVSKNEMIETSLKELLPMKFQL